MIEPETLIGKYRIKKMIGAGGMANVYQAEDTVMGRQVAMKVLSSEFARDPERIMRFYKEVRSLAALDHPNIVTIFDVGDDNGSYFYTMALLSGGDLKGRIRQGLIPDNIMDIMKQMADALRFAHGKGLIHRDIKPTNIMFDGEGRPLLTDLGIAKAIGSDTDADMTRTGTSIGTPRYMSPEQVQGQKGLDGRSDLYSLGVVLYEALTGNVPFDAETPMGIAMQHVKSPIPKLPRSLKSYQSLVNQLLAKEPRYRFVDASALIQAIERLLIEVKRDRPTDTTQAMGDGPKKSRFIWLGFGGLAALIVAGVFFFFLLQSHRTSPTDGVSASVAKPQKVPPDEQKKAGPEVAQPAQKNEDTRLNEKAIEGPTNMQSAKPSTKPAKTTPHPNPKKKRPKAKQQIAGRSKPVRKTRLRHTPKKIGVRYLEAMIKKFNFCDRKRNSQGDFKNVFVDNKNGTITDRATGLIWEKQGSTTNLSHDKVEQYIQELNRYKFAGHANWRLPTIDELASLIESSPIHKNRLYINPMFSDPNGRWVNWYWSSDSITDPTYGFPHGNWIADFSGGTIFDGSWGNKHDSIDRRAIEAMVKAVCARRSRNR